MLGFLFVTPAFAQESYVCGVYLTGVGCPHCAKADPSVLGDFVKAYPTLIVIEYELYQHPENAQIVYSYFDTYHSEPGIPQIIFNPEEIIRGDTPLLTQLPSYLNSKQNNPCPLLGEIENFEDLDLSVLPGTPTIWYRDRVLMKGMNENYTVSPNELLVSEDIEAYLEGKKYLVINPRDIAISGGYVGFEKAIEIAGWIFQWERIPGSSDGDANNNPGDSSDDDEIKVELTWSKLISLAAVDAINPCALAVLTLMLIAIITYDPKKKENILYAGLAFSFSVYVMYLFYGLILIKFFQVIQALASIRLLLYQVLGVAAIILGFLNLKDFFWYKPGGFMTEMPMRMRPAAGKLIKKMTSPQGAFLLGAFVTIFLLPCTIGPYVIASGILSILDLVQTLPYLLIYNFIFILPMLAITASVYLGFARAQEVKEWKNKNVRYLHLVSGTIIIILGILMVFGLL